MMLIFYLKENPFSHRSARKILGKIPLFNYYEEKKKQEKNFMHEQVL